ncbi:MAG: [FeFe] hydrogenase H-cluster radical SAM maturase HydG [Lentisphaerae bacterium]|nr:[FeFe] hydrogenase H-cluster radical SAM maturase HydG [Lentisphaerota bacterium]
MQTCASSPCSTDTTDTRSFLDRVIVRDEIDRYYQDGRDFIDDDRIERDLKAAVNPDPSRVRDILAKSLAIETLLPEETAVLLQVTDPGLRQEMETAALAIKHKVYDNRIVTFAPMYISSHCVNRCLYCGFRADNRQQQRRQLTLDEIKAEAAAMCGRDGHKRVMAVYGEHPKTNAAFIAESLQAIYSVEVPTRRGRAAVRRINVNAAPMSIADLKTVQQAGIGTFQVFQETYHHPTYARVHPAGTIKGDYGWRLTSMHRAFDAGIDDVGLGALFGLADWKFEVMGLVTHARELERYSGVGPHTFSVPRLHPASGSEISRHTLSPFSDDDFIRAVTVLRLSVPYTGLIVTARETKELRERCLDLGCTQMDASTRIGVGAYAAASVDQEIDKQQFLLGDNRTLEELIVDLARRGTITSFCTAGYRCGRTGGCIMDMLKTGKEGKFCKINAVLTFREWLDDFASPASLAVCEPVLNRELAAIEAQMPAFYPTVKAQYDRIVAGERDLYF